VSGNTGSRYSLNSFSMVVGTLSQLHLNPQLTNPPLPSYATCVVTLEANWLSWYWPVHLSTQSGRGHSGALEYATAVHVMPKSMPMTKVGFHPRLCMAGDCEKTDGRLHREVVFHSTSQTVSCRNRWLRLSSHTFRDSTRRQVDFSIVKSPL